MSYWITLEENGQLVDVDRHREGGTYPLNGTTEAEVNVTYNYNARFDFSQLDNRQARDVSDLLSTFVLENGTERDPNYWRPTPGNVGHICRILYLWGRQHPDAIWQIT